MHILYEIDTGPVTYPIDARRRRTSIPALTHTRIHLTPWEIYQIKHKKILSFYIDQNYRYFTIKVIECGARGYRIRDKIRKSG